MDKKVVIAKNDQYKNGVRVVEICNDLEAHHPSWLISIKNGNYSECYAVYAESHESAIAAFCRHEVKNRQIGRGGLVKTVSEIDIDTLSPTMSDNGFISVGGSVFCVNGIKAERARLLSVSARYEAMLSSASLDTRLSNIKLKIAEIISKQERPERLAKAYEVFEGLGGDLLGKHQIHVVLSSDRGRFDEDVFATDLMGEFNRRGIPNSAYHIEGDCHKICIDTNEFDSERIMMAVNKVVTTDPSGVVSELTKITGNHPFVKELGKNNENVLFFAPDSAPKASSFSI